jgi:hypothetical protein
MANEAQLFSAEPPQQTGMSGTTKVLLGLGCGCGFLMVAVCAGIFGVGWFFVDYVKNARIEEPATIRKLTNDIVTIEIPAGLEPELAFDAKVPFSKEPLGIAVVYSNDNEARLLLVELKAPVPDKRQREKIEAQIHDFLEKGGENEKQIRIESATPHTVTIHGEPAKFSIGKGINREDQKSMWQVTGEFAGLEGPAQLSFVAPLDDFSEEELIKMLDSMQDEKLPAEREVPVEREMPAKPLEVGK